MSLLVVGGLVEAEREACRELRILAEVLQFYDFREPRFTLESLTTITLDMKAAVRFGQLNTRNPDEIVEGFMCVWCDREIDPRTHACPDRECEGCTHLACDDCGRSTAREALVEVDGLLVCGWCRVTDGGDACGMCGETRPTYAHAVLGTACSECLTDAANEAHALGMRLEDWVEGPARRVA